MMDNANICSRLEECYQIYDEFKWIIDCYVLDFFTENHWEKLNETWKLLNNLSSESIADLLDHEVNVKSMVFPLSILSLKVLFRNVCIPRGKSDIDKRKLNFKEDEKIYKLFWKNIKLKKRHEIDNIAEVCYKSAVESNCYYIVDVGSGLGHLSRMLCYGYGFKSCAIEAQNQLTYDARILDQNFQNFLEKLGHEVITQRTIHMNLRLDPDISSVEFENIVQEAFNIESENFKFGMVGLHPCGDLGATLLRLYNESPNIIFINIVGCCYMKLTSGLSKERAGYPLSTFCKKNNYDLSYHSKEIACHAIESYIHKLKGGEYWKLKIHAYRATIEKLLSYINPKLKHCALANVKYVEDLSFESYCRKATSKFNISIDTIDIYADEIHKCLEEWNNVVVFYSLRLFFAPLIESLILLDRLLYIRENGSTGEIIALFDPRISPRNHVLTARKLI